MRTEIRRGGEKIILLKPMTYMNGSGRSVRAAVDFYKLELGLMLIVCDDLNLKLGKFRFRTEGSAGGNNGLKDIIAQLGTESFARLRVGISAPDGRDAADYVLGRFSAAEEKLAEDCFIEAARAVELWDRDGVNVAMNEYNGKDLSKE
jgi:PTH1 family peptidyl-tRNA hydrolase